jgi:drug/metabolite transporter (DMT)-like permease
MAAGLAAVAMWAAYLAFARAGVKAGLAPVDFVVLRFGTAGAIMLLWLLRHEPRTLGGVGWGRGAALALLAGPLFIALGVGGYTFAPLAHGAVIQPSTLVLGAMFAGWAFFGERPSRTRIVGMGVIVAGLALIAAGKGGAEMPGAWRGDLLFVAAGLSWVAFTMLLRQWRVGALPAAAAVAVVSALVVVPGVLLFGTLDRIAALPVPALVAQVLVQGVGSGVLAVIAYGRAVEHLGAARAALFPALVPGAALLVGISVANEVPAFLEWLGAAVVTAGLIVALELLRKRSSGTRDPQPVQPSPERRCSTQDQAFVALSEAHQDGAVSARHQEARVRLGLVGLEAQGLELRSHPFVLHGRGRQDNLLEVPRGDEGRSLSGLHWPFRHNIKLKGRRQAPGAVLTISQGDQS